MRFEGNSVCAERLVDKTLKIMGDFGGSNVQQTWKDNIIFIFYQLENIKIMVQNWKLKFMITIPNFKKLIYFFIENEIFI